MEYTLGKFKSTDVIVMATMLSKIGLGKMADGFGRDNLLKIIADNEGKTEDEVAAFTGMEMVLKIVEIILGNAGKIENELFRLLASVYSLTVDDIRGLDAEVFAEMIIEVVQGQQFKDFFKLASRLLNTAR